ncbi:MAG: hypothetical protein ACXVA9_09860, partial [Bdellovibrionales bacterium]
PFRGSNAIILSYQSIRANLNTACAGCHQAPSKTGGFTYIDQWQGQEVTMDGTLAWYPGFSDVAEKMRDYMTHPDLSKRMPPQEKRSKNPESFLEMARQLNLWILAGKPNGTFEAGKAPVIKRGKDRPEMPHDTSDLGDCVPTAKAVGTDYGLDRAFENAKQLPKFLSQTDLITLDPFTLAQHGTLAYNVEYPLWADNAEKGRWIHVPMAMVDGKLQKQSIDLDSVTGQFHIPQNTRFYKTFYRAVKLPNKETRMRRMETRLIVTRKPWQNSLFGTYQWDESEQVATLVDAPYRDGTPWADQQIDVMIDLKSEKLRPYAIPGKQRCIDCHMGSPMQNFVLGFQPLQINKRDVGYGGRLDPASDNDLDQVARFISYGILSGIKSADELPVLEKSGTSPPRNDYELRANGYTVGNCYHCHNPNGLAFTKENGIQLALGPGEIFSFNTHRTSVEMPNRRLVHQEGDLDSSHIWRKVSDSQAQLGLFSQMPMHTPGSPDCRVLTVIGKWIRSFESPQAAEDWSPACKKENPFFWIDLDFTWVNSDVYTPRRNDWKDPKEGMPQKYRDIVLTSSLQSAIQTEYPVGYWLNKPECTFPTVDLPAEKQRPWMLAGGKPKRPFGQVYYTTPGSYFFRNTCMKCHGPGANGDSSLARGILNWSGGKVRVANLIDGLFGKKNDNLKTFDLDGKNLAGNYLIWMAMEGTKVQFPPELSSFLGKHGGQMLNGIRDKCLAQISSDKPSSPYFTDYEVFNKVCFMDNLAPGDPGLEFDTDTNEPLHPEAVEQWLDRGAWNAGWAIFDFLKEASSGHWRQAVDQCELLYGPAPQPVPVPPPPPLPPTSTP